MSLKFFYVRLWEQSLGRVSLRGNTKMAETKMAKFKMAEFKMATIIKLRINEFESDWISLSQSQIGVRVFLSESERR